MAGLLTLTADDYPAIDRAEVGSVARRGYGTVEDVRVPCIVAGATAHLAAAMTASATSITVDDGSRFPAAPFTAQIGGEIMTVGAISGNALSSIARAAYGTTAQPHSAGRTVCEVRTSYVYLVSDQPVDAISAVYVDGEKQASGYTAYTGQAGDAHADWAGQAVVEFAVDPFVGPQRNLADAGTEDVTPTPTLCTDDGTGDYITLLGGTINFPIGYDSGRQSFWISWPTTAGYGTIVKDFATVVLSEAGAGSLPARVRISSRNIATGATIKTEVVYLDADAASRSCVVNLGTAWGVQLTITAETGSATVVSVTRTTTRAQQADAEPLTTITDTPLLASDERLGASSSDTGVPLSPGTLAHLRVQYSPTDRGTVAACYAYGSLYSVAGGEVWICGVNGTTLVSREKITVPAGGMTGLLATISGGGWATHFVLIAESGAINVEYLTRVITVLNNGATASGTTSARATIGARVTVDAAWHYDGDGTYGGAGNLIERPDWCIKHFLRNYMSAATGEIDATTFSAAGTLYAGAITGGYKFGFIVPKQDSAATLKSMAFCSRSTVRFIGGVYYLHYTPDSAPASVATLSRADLKGAGSRYVYAKDSIRAVFNSVDASYSPNYSGDTSREIVSGFLASTSAEDAASIAKYGTFHTTYSLPCIRWPAMAAHVLAHHLLETRAPLLTVAFVTSWEHSNLQPGQTITITDDLYTGRQWWAEAVRRPDKFTAAIVAREWWA